MSDQAVTTPIEALTVTSLAAEKIRELMAERQMTDVALRVFVAGGGCSGMQYGMAFEPNPNANDVTISVEDDVRIVVDPLSLPYIEGATVDFIDSLMGGGFKIENPNAVSSCGCGTSFRTKDEGGAASSAAGGASCGCG